MHDSALQDHATVVRAAGEISLPEFAAIATLASRERQAGRTAVIDVSGVTHLHYAGAALLKHARGVRIAGASRYVRDLICSSGAGAHVEFYPDVNEALAAP